MPDHSQMKNENAIFISYRRADSRWTARAVAERLAAYFGQRMTFMDVENIEGGQNFVETIDQALMQCGALLALIGEQWLADRQGQCPLDNPNDYVRREIETALKQNILIVPVLVDEATMPSEQDLPPNLVALHRCHAVPLRHADFRRDIEKLINLLERSLKLPMAPVPWLDMPWQERRDPVQSAQWLRYWHRHAEFVGRNQEMQDLDQFFLSDKHFAWFAIMGPGGVGKSRLALESLLSLKGDWHRGFLKEEDRKTLDWRLWRPQVATAIVVDYAAQDPDWLVEWLDTLCRAQFKWPVRVLLIERATHTRKDEKQYWWKKLTTGRASALDRVEAFYKLDEQKEPQPLPLRPFVESDQRHLLWSFLKAAGKETEMPPQEHFEIWTTLDKLTEEGRPLYVGMVAAAIAAGGINQIRHWDRGNLLQHILDKEQEIWDYASQRETPDKVARHAVRLIAIATACGGLIIPDERTAAHVDTCLRDANLLDEVSTRELYETAAAMTGSGAYSLEPDLLGEYFLTTQQWSIPNTEDIDERTQLLTDLLCAWDLNPLGCTRTLLRTIADFPNHSKTTSQWLSFLTKRPARASSVRIVVDPHSFGCKHRIRQHLSLG